MATLKQFFEQVDYLIPIHITQDGEQFHYLLLFSQVEFFSGWKSVGEEI